jgi:hypothetical protein
LSHEERKYKRRRHKVPGDDIARRLSLSLVEDAANGKYKSLDEARQRNGICGCPALGRRAKQYGREDILPRNEKSYRIDRCERQRRRLTTFITFIVDEPDKLVPFVYPVFPLDTACSGV